MKKIKHIKNNKCDSIFSFGNSIKLKPDQAANEDPVLKAKKKKKKPVPAASGSSGKSAKGAPSLGYREEVKSHCHGNEPVLAYGDPKRPYYPPRFLPPKTKKYLKGREEAKKKYEEDLNFCKHIMEATNMPKLPAKERILQITIPSPEQSASKVQPRGLSPTMSTIVPIVPNPKELELKKPKSGIIVNDTTKIDDYDSFDLVYKRQPRPGFEQELKALRKSKKKKRLESIHEEDERKDLEALMEKELMEHALQGEGEDAPSTRLIDEEEGTDEEEGEGEGELTKVFRKKVEQMSASTSYRAKDFGGEEEEEKPEKLPPVGQMTQKFRRGSEIDRFTIPPPKIKRGTLESHSFTKIEQPTLKDFFYGTIAGTMHQAAQHFPEHIKNNQGLTMPVTAYCYALLKHPSAWDEKDVDEIIEAANSMYIECFHKMNRNKGAAKLSPDDLPRYCYLFDKKIRFKLSEPQVTGIIKSDQKNVFNLTKGIHIFFSRYNAGIFQTKGVNIAIWRDKYYYFFDARPRTRDLYPDPDGTALMANFYDVDSIISVLLDRCLFGNWPFVIISIEAFSIQNRNEPEERESSMDIEDRATYSVLSDRKAVVLGSFDLADMCFEFARNKQALAIAAVALVYSRISPPSSWFKKTVDKIMIIGNQLYLECVNHKPLAELKLEQLPAEFSLGPYSVEVYIKPNVYGDYICRKGQCILEVCMERFFETYSMAITILGNCTVAIWKQRGVFYCFDPYSRNIQGYAARNGVACVSMHSDLDSLTWMLAKNYCGKDTIFYIHALVVCRITREHAITCAIPMNLTMDGISHEDLKKSTKKKGLKLAIGKPIQVKEDANKSIAAPPIEVAEGESLVQVDSNVGSLAMSTLPHFTHFPHLKTPLGGEKIADLDSPSLSDTQLEPPQIKDQDEGLMKVDIDSYQLTMEELEGKGEKGKGEGDKAKGGDKKKDDKAKAETKAGEAPKPGTGKSGEAAAGGDQKKEGAEGEEFYMAADAVTEVHSKSFLNATSINLSAGLSGFMLHPEVLPPTNLAKTLGRKRRVFYKSQQGSIILGYEPEPDITQSEELRKENNFVDLPDNSQIVRGKSNMADLENQGGDMEYLAPFVCIMAAAVAKKFSLVSWSADVVEYVLKCGQELFKASKFRYDQVSRLDIPKVSLGSTDFHITVDYLFDTYLKDNILEVALDRILFTRSDCGIFVTPSYACAIFYRHHLYYLYDGYGNNEIGLSEGKMNTGVACLVRFKDLRSLVQRIIYNKSVRDGVEPVEYSRFVISRVVVIALNPPKPKPPEEERGEEDDEEWEDIDEEDELEQEGEEEEPQKDKETKPKVEVGWKWYRGIGTIRGSKSIKGRGVGENEIKPDHFACICACLMLIEVPIDKWDTAKVDNCLDQGRNIYNHADDLCATEKRIIKNVLIRKHFFDIIVKKIQIINYSQNKDMDTGIDTLFGRRYSYFIVQMVGYCTVIYKGGRNCYYLFDPYPINRKGKPVDEGKAGWIRYKKLKQVKRRLTKEAFKTGGLYAFYTFEVTSIKKAPKGIVIGHKMHLYEVQEPKKKEKISKPFHEEVYWLNMDPIPWSRMVNKTPSGIPRGCPDIMWHNWDMEYSNDLFSMIGNVHQASTMFPRESRGKQTLCNLVMVIGMLQIYDLKTWSPAIIDSVLVNGDNYCRDCIQDIKDENYELGMDDLKKDCEIFPYSFRVEVSTVVDGTMFLLRSRSFNMYKALRYFFDDFERRFGIVVVTKNNGKRQVAFGKTKELEYFMFDCEAVGSPMFADGKAVAYILRTTTLNRLLHVLTLTLRGGDFFIFEVKTKDLKPVN